MIQPGLDTLRASLSSTDPLDIVNAFMKTPGFNSVDFDPYWEHRFCALAEMIVEKSKIPTPRSMDCWIAEDRQGTRIFRSCRGTASACWAALCGLQDREPLELQRDGWNVVRFAMNPVETDTRYREFDRTSVTEG